MAGGLDITNSQIVARWARRDQDLEPGLWSLDARLQQRLRARDRLRERTPTAHVVDEFGATVACHGPGNTTTGIADARGLPSSIALEQNYRNPFNPRRRSGSRSRVRSVRGRWRRTGSSTALTVYDLLGHPRSRSWSARDEGARLITGVVWDGRAASGITCTA